MREHSKHMYTSPIPYPEIKVEKPNIHYAEILMDDYAGLISEFSAISQYIYHSYDFVSEKHKELSHMWISIAEVEMHHLNMIAQVITLLGGNPKFRGSKSTNNAPWNGTFVYYGDNICSQLKADLNSEVLAINQYKNHMELIDDKYIKAIIERIILDEKVHILYFQEALKKYCP